MKVSTPTNPAEAKSRLDVLLQQKEPLRTVPRSEFSAGWAALAYLHSGLHPDEVDNSDGGWPADLKQIGVEAWRRYEAGEFADEELYPSDAQWAGIFDQLDNPTEEEIERRRLISGNA